ncbi:MAG: Male sterility domain protein [Schlesneria sp.]|nr:Male sterility domain protein [Schlesneria sp.]
MAVLVRPSRHESGHSRIERLLQNLENQLQRKFVRPTVLEGSLVESGLGLSRADRQWLSRRCASVIHSAASVTFTSSPGSREPWLTNVEGTRNLLELCCDIGLDDFHHVSTAFVCGLRNDRILESDLSGCQSFKNEYERSKFDAEKLVQEFSRPRRATIYRPSIVVGEHSTGRTTSFRGLYAPLQLLILYAISNRLHEFPPLDAVGLTGSEEKNLVPVDWVSRVIWHLMRCPDSAGRTFHLTNPRPTLVARIMNALQDSLNAVHGKVGDWGAPAPSQFESDSFNNTLGIYQSYFSSDPEFDCSQTVKFAPGIRCPEMDDATLVQMMTYAIRHRFVMPRTQPESAVRIEEHLQSVFPDVSTTSAQANDWLQLEVSGRGGGAWQIGFLNNVPVCLDRGIDPNWDASAYCSAETFSLVVDAKVETADAMARGAIIMQAKGRPVGATVRLFTELQQAIRLASSGLSR